MTQIDLVPMPYCESVYRAQHRSRQKWGLDGSDSSTGRQYQTDTVSMWANKEITEQYYIENEQKKERRALGNRTNHVEQTEKNYFGRSNRSESLTTDCSLWQTSHQRKKLR